MHQLAEAVGQVVVSDAVLIEVELGEQQPVEGPLEVVVGPAVAGLRVTQQIERQQEELAAGVEAASGGLQLTLDVGPAVGDGGQLLLELGLRPARRADQVEVLVFLAIEPNKPLTQVLPGGAEAGQLGLECLVELVADPVLEGGAQSDAGVMALDRPTDDVDGQVRQRAGLELATAAKEVAVGTAITAGLGQDEPAAAAGAPQAAFEVVVMLPLAGAVAAAQVK